MAHTNTWNAAFEALPPDTGENIAIGANRIRALKNAIRERMAADHYMAIAGTDADHGQHKLITFQGNQATPANTANKSFLYPQEVSNVLELFWLDDANNGALQITSNGALNVNEVIPANTKMLFYADSAPTGWTIKNTLDDKLVFVTKGSGAGGESGGAAHANGTWTQANHTLTVNEIPSHNHGDFILRPQVDGAGESHWISPGVGNVTTANTGGGNAHSHGNAWRPAAYCFIICEKD